jgi:hypothetical protein
MISCDADWLASTVPFALIESSLIEGGSHRKRNLLAVACLRRVAHLLPGPICKQAVELFEHYAEGNATLEELANAQKNAREEMLAVPNPDGNRLPQVDAGCAVIGFGQEICPILWHCAEATAWAKAGTPEAISEAEWRAQCDLVRDIFANPFRPVTLHPAWLTPKVKTVAQTIYNNRAFERLPELAGALAEAGCSNPDILSHCCGPGPHVRGCWVVDLVLGKE